MPTRRREATMPIDSSTRIASRATLRDSAVLRADPLEREHLPGGYSPGHDRGAERGEQIAVQSADVWLRGHAYILS